MSELSADFGNAAAEYHAARDGTGIVAGTMQVVWAAGEDAVDFLDGQLSQDLVAMAPGEVARSLLLEPRGKLVAVMWVLRDEGRIGMAVDAGVAAEVVTRLEEFRFRVDVELSVDGRASHELWGRESAATAHAAGLDLGSGWTDEDGRLVALLRGRAIDRVLVLGDPAPLYDSGVTPIGQLALSTVRIEAGEPVMGIDLDSSIIPQESGLVPEAVSFTKGCFVGQELVARIDSRGRVNRRLAGLLLDTNVVPPVGAEIVAEGEVRGEVTRVGESLALRAPVAWGLVRREVADGDPVKLRWEGGSAPATVRELPLADFSGPAHTPLTSDSDGEGHRTGA